MMQKAMFIDYEYCTGCHSCEMACKAEKKLEKGQFGIMVSEIGPWKIDEKKWQYDHIPALTDMCDLCSDRALKGKPASCVQHCQADIIRIGTLEEMAILAATKSKTVVYTR